MATVITTGKVRLSYAHLFTPYSNQPGQEAKYSVSVIIPKSDKKTIEAVKKAIEEASRIGISSKWGGKTPKNLHIPLRDGDEKDDEGYKGSYFFNCSSTRPPVVVDKNREVILDPNEVYSGCYARVNVNFYAYAVSGNSGVAAGLNAVQKVADGEPFGASAPSIDAAFGDDFDDFEEDDSLFD